MDQIDYIYIILAIVFAGFILFRESHYRVKEDDQVFLTESGEGGKEDGKIISTPGLYFKIPFQKVHYFPKRAQPLQNQSELLTKDQKVIRLDTRALWKIDDPSKFLNSIHYIRDAEDIVWSAISRAERGIVKTIELGDLFFEPVDSATGNMECNAEMLRRIHEKAQEDLQKYGILLLNIEITHG